MVGQATRAVIYMGDGRRIECDVDYPQMEMTGIVRKMINEEKDKDMERCEDACSDTCKGKDSEKSLSEQFNDLELDNSRQTLVKAGLMESNGTLTSKGRDFLLNFLARENEDELAEAVEEIEAARRGKKSDD